MQNRKMKYNIKNAISGLLEQPWIPKFLANIDQNIRQCQYQLTSLRGRRWLGGQLGGRCRQLRRRGCLLLGGGEELGRVVVVDVAKEIELVP
jgi:hypothetical protein